MEKHTFVICAFRQSPYLEDCIQSCINQNSVITGESKVILYTSTPNDYIIDQCRKYNIPFFEKEGGGIGRDWNNALSFVQTKYATIAHQDDVYLPEYGEKIISEFEKSKEYNIVFSDYEENDFNGEIRKRGINLKIKTIALTLMFLFKNKRYQRRIYSFGNFISCPAVSYNLERLKHFRFNEQLKMTLDWDAWERIMKLPGKIGFVKDKLMYHRIHEDSETTNNTKDQTRESEEFDMYKRYWGPTIARFLMRFYVLNQKSNQ
ncbi:glycosyltransferase family A protein [Enterococcus avium]|uniref:glycosyltransferase family A protein n=1 Tax=Enterococcus avium TaxID=33945 RepID=UPI002891F17E|nr:glycosyltransferase family A protein [Enterococcus avium]MDT2435476.1 glycosyltransferase family A protein [Enterococcus avium]MDT2466296.1 glycosyltransferase family A protein [Enterococcus avium]MDT2505631.1 glycosyltransferase family A protein [Enterococcus avium]